MTPYYPGNPSNETNAKPNLEASGNFLSSIYPSKPCQLSLSSIQAAPSDRASKFLH